MTAKQARRVKSLENAIRCQEYMLSRVKDARYCKSAETRIRTAQAKVAAIKLETP